MEEILELLVSGNSTTSQEKNTSTTPSNASNNDSSASGLSFQDGQVGEVMLDGLIAATEAVGELKKMTHRTQGAAMKKSTQQCRSRDQVQQARQMRNSMYALTSFISNTNSYFDLRAKPERT